MTAIGLSERHYVPEWAMGAVDVCEIDAVMMADDEWRFGQSIPVRAGTPSSRLVETSDRTMAVNVYGCCERASNQERDGVWAQFQEVLGLIDESTQSFRLDHAGSSTAAVAMR